MYYYGAGKSATTTLFKLCGTNLIQTESGKESLALWAKEWATALPYLIKWERK